MQWFKVYIISELKKLSRGLSEIRKPRYCGKIGEKFMVKSIDDMKKSIPFIPKMLTKNCLIELQARWLARMFNELISNHRFPNINRIIEHIEVLVHICS